MNKQFNVTLPVSWLKELSKKSFEKSLELEETVSVQDMIRTAIREKYQFDQEYKNGKKKLF